MVLAALMNVISIEVSSYHSSGGFPRLEQLNPQ